MNTHTTTPLSARFARFIAALCCSALVGAAHAQDLGIKAPAQAMPVLIYGGTVHTVSGETFDPGYVRFAEGKITDIGAYEDGMVFTADAVNIDASGKHVYPGLIGSNTQLGLTEISAVRASEDHNEVGGFTPEVRASISVNPDSTLIPVTRANGVLVAAVLPTGGRVPGRASVMQLDGWTTEDMTVLDDAASIVSYPRVRPRTAWFVRESPEDQRKQIKKNIDELERFFVSARTYVSATGADVSHPTDLRFEAMRPFLPTSDGGGAQRPTIIGANDADQITAAVNFAIEHGLRAVILGGRDAPMVADLLKKHDVPVIVAGTNGFPKRADSAYDDAFSLPARLEAVGVRWCLASGEETAHERTLPHGAGRAVAYGLSPEAALRSITFSAAEILGVADRLGSLEVGKDATLFIADGDILEITTTVERAFIGGREIDLRSKQDALADKYREKYRQIGGPGSEK